jgi:hypothetical protein
MAQTPVIDMYVADSSGDEVYSISFNPEPGTATAALTLRLYNNESTQGTSSNLLFAIRCDLIRTAPAWEDTAESNANGEELMVESWLEVASGGSGWVPIDEWSSGGHDVGAIAAGAYTEFTARLNVSSDATTIGECNFCLVVRSLP